MALTDEQKLNVVRAKFTQKLNSYGDWTVFKTFLGGITKTKIKNFIKTAISEEADALTVQSDDLDEMAIDYGDLGTEIDAI